MTGKCIMCGREFEVKPDRNGYIRSTCSAACAARRAGRNTGLPSERFENVSLEILRKAKKCPKRCSWTRWKMELSRRLEREMGSLAFGLPDPDWLR
ncbi:MAG: hypothetical protein J6V72_20620 [Kiritimatiellae bacterium]|nr:hypothetical protein [Kiritimatiellia bacterium]